MRYADGRDWRKLFPADADLAPPAGPQAPERPARARTYAEEDPPQWYGLVSAPLWVAWRLTRRGWESVSSHDDPATLDELVRSRYGAACRVVVLPMGRRPEAEASH
jgi:hypothetical protein